MNTGLPLFVIGLIFGGGIGFVIAATNGITLDGHDHSNPAHHASHGATAAHDHSAMLDVPTGAKAASLSTTVTQDPMSGWNLNIGTQNFTFAPQNASLAHVPGEGHAHIYINGEKLGRVYSNWVHLDTLPSGDVEIKVTLNANDHRHLSVGGEPLTATVVVKN